MKSSSESQEKVSLSFSVHLFKWKRDNTIDILITFTITEVIRKLIL